MSLREVLDHAAASKGPDVDVESVRALLEHQVAAAVAESGWAPDDPLRLAKHSVGWLVRCARRAVTAQPPAEGRDIALGAVIDAVAKNATVKELSATAAVESALEWLRVEQPATTAAAFVDALGDVERAEFVDEAVKRATSLLAIWPAIEPSWWPRIDEWLRLHLAGGAISVAGRIDVVFGGPPTGRPAVLVEVKGGAWHDSHRADAHLYALLAALRDGEAPLAVVTVAARDGAVDVEPVREGVLEAAAGRVLAAVEVAARLATGEVPTATPGAYCPTCPALLRCPAASAA